MIATDILSGDDSKARHAAKMFINTGEIEAEDAFVTYDVFSRIYWPHFPQPLTKGLGEYWISHTDEFRLISHLYHRTLACLLRVHGCVVSIYDGYDCLTPSQALSRDPRSH